MSEERVTKREVELYAGRILVHCGTDLLTGRFGRHDARIVVGRFGEGDGATSAARVRVGERQGAWVTRRAATARTRARVLLNWRGEWRTVRAFSLPRFPAACAHQACIVLQIARGLGSRYSTEMNPCAFQRPALHCPTTSLFNGRVKRQLHFDTI